MTSAKIRSLACNTVSGFTTAAPAFDTNPDWAFIPALHEIPEPTLGVERETAQQSNTRGNMAASYHVKKNAAHSFETLIHTGTKSFDAAWGADTSPTLCYAQRLLESFFGVAANEGADFIGTTLTGGTTAIPDFTNADNLTVGMGVAISNSASTTADNMQFRHVTKKATLAITVDRVITAATTGFYVAGSYNFKPTLGASSTYLYLHDDMDGNGNSWLLGPGRINSLELSGFTGSGGLRYKFGFIGDSWVVGSDASNDGDLQSQAGNSSTANSFSTPLIGTGGIIAINGTATRCASANIKFDIPHEPIVASADTALATAPNGRAGYEIVAPFGCTGEIQQYHDATRFDEHAANTVMPLCLAFSIGTSNQARVRGAASLFIPQAEIDVKPTKINGQRGLSFSFKAIDPTTAQVADGLTKPFYYSPYGGI